MCPTLQIVDGIVVRVPVEEPLYEPAKPERPSTPSPPQSPVRVRPSQRSPPPSPPLTSMKQLSPQENAQEAFDFEAAKSTLVEQVITHLGLRLGPSFTTTHT